MLLNVNISAQRNINNESTFTKVFSWGLKIFKFSSMNNLPHSEEKINSDFRYNNKNQYLALDKIPVWIYTINTEGYCDKRLLH